MLTDADRAIIDFENQWWKFPAMKEEAIRERFGMSAIRYYQRLNALILNPEAVVYAPVVVNRLRRARTARRRDYRAS